jgi:hypothetical protein
MCFEHLYLIFDLYLYMDPCTKRYPCLAVPHRSSDQPRIFFLEKNIFFRGGKYMLLDILVIVNRSERENLIYCWFNIFLVL